jgi:DNA polymerase III subunit delta'
MRAFVCTFVIAMKFSEVIGKQDIKDRLIQSVRDGRISHAQLFAGGEGSYGLAMALAYASFIQCENPLADDSCGNCSACVKNRKLVHPDLHFSFPVVTSPHLREKSPKSSDFINTWRKAVLENPYLDLTAWYEYLGVENKQSFISVEESADIIRKMSLKPYEAEYKILIIWMPEKMRAESANKLLKLIEEPPDRTLFILVTAHRTHLLATILSRTQLVKTPDLSVPELTEAVKTRFSTDARHARRVASLARGSIHTAFSLATETEREFDLETHFITWMRLCYAPFHEKDGKYAWSDLNSWIEEVAKSGRENLKLFIGFCLEATRECLISNHGDSSMVRFDEEVIPNFSRFSRFIHSGNVAEIADLLNKAHYAIERNANPRILLLDLSFKMNRLLNVKLV